MGMRITFSWIVECIFVNFIIPYPNEELFKKEQCCTYAACGGILQMPIIIQGEVYKMKKNEILLWLGRWTSKIGNIVFDYVNSVLIVGLQTENSILLALYQGSESIIKIVFSLLGGAVSDKSNARKLLIITDMISASICIGLSFFTDSKYLAYLLLVANVLLELVSAFNSPSYKSIVRKAIDKERVAQFNSISNGGSEAIGLIAPLLGVVIIEFFGPKCGIIFNGITFFISGLLECKIVTENAINKKKDVHIIKDVLDGVKYLISERRLFSLIIFSMIINFVLAGYNLMVPYSEVMFQNIYPHFYSKLLIVEGVGGLLGSVVSSKLRFHMDKVVGRMITFILGAGLSLILIVPLSSSSAPFLIMLPFLCFIVCVTIYNVQFMTYVQLAVDEDYIGRVFSMISTVTTLLLPIGAIFFSLILKPTNKVCFTAFGIIISVLSFVSYMVLGRKRGNRI